MPEYSMVISDLIRKKTEELACLQKQAESLSDEIETLRKSLTILKKEEKNQSERSIAERNPDFSSFVAEVTGAQHISIGELAAIIGLSEQSIRNWMQKATSPVTKSKAVLANQLSSLIPDRYTAPEIMEALNIWFPKEAS